jgi:small-conductance mechanosensitive channel
VSSWLDSIGIDGKLLLVNLIFALVALGAARFASRMLRGYVVAALSEKSFGRNGAVLLGRLSSIAVYVFAFILVLGKWGVSSTGILTFLGAFSVALGLSLQDVFRNFFSGIFLLMERPFRVGDHIRVRDVEGEVQGIDVRTTIVKVANGSIVLLPNSIVLSDILTRRSQSGVRRLDFRITTEKDGALEVERWVHATLEGLAFVKKPVAAPIVRTVGEGGTVLELSILVDDRPEHVQRTIDALTSGDESMEVERL